MTSAGRLEQRWITVLDGKRLRQLRRQRGLSQEKLATTVLGEPPPSMRQPAEHTPRV